MQKINRSFILGLFLGGLSIFALYKTLLIEYTTVTYLPDGGEYIGERKGDLFHGVGKIEWPDGSVYKGAFSDGVIEGRGVLVTAEGTEFEGEFRNGMFNGEGIYRSSGDTYKGYFQNNFFHGYGEYISSNGDRYVGDFKDGFYNGKGEYTTRGNDRYIGHFERGEFTGKGLIRYSDGMELEGDFENWVLNGNGSQLYPDSGKYIGYFDNGILSGEGEHLAVDGSHYVGGFRYGIYHGMGELTFKNGKRYKGNFRDGSFHGNGVLTLENGDLYEGEFEYGRYHGKGTLTFKETLEGLKEIRGEWRRGVLHRCEGVCRIKTQAQNVELALYNQNILLNSQDEGLRKSAPGQIDLYFFGVAGYGSQSVFRREVQFAKDYFDSNYRTEGASIVLINDRSTVENYPLATITSVKRSLESIAGKMDVDEDILFVFFTSHGSKNHEFSLEQPGLNLDDITAEELSSIFKNSPVKWKVLVLSSCYSGGYIAPLANENTLIITSASPDRKSFGCNDENQFTDFGEAFFKSALPESENFIDAFERAKAIVMEKEEANGLVHSEPQISYSPAILDQLQKWRNSISVE